MKIDEFIALDLEEGYVAMDQDGQWNWFQEEPVLDIRSGVWDNDVICSISSIIYIEPVHNWKNSLRKVG